MKKIYLLFTLFILSTIHAQIDQKINKSAGVVLNPITQIDSIRFSNNQTMHVVLKDGNIINHTISDVNNVKFSMPSYPGGVGNCSGYPTAVVEVLNPITGKIWMDRNLGASRAATSVTDALAYGDLYQWGRTTDGHQCRNSVVRACTSVCTVTSDQPGGFFFISDPWNTDWKNSKNDALWQGQFSTSLPGALNIPCPINYRLPTAAELESERQSWTSNSSIGAFNSPLKFTNAGKRVGTGGSNLPYLNGVGTYGAYWSSTINIPSSINNNDSQKLNFNSGSAIVSTDYRANALSVRCIKAKGTIRSLWCETPNYQARTDFGRLYTGVAATGVSTSGSFFIGNYGSYDYSISVASTGVTGLTANLVAAGDFLSGQSKELTFTISGTPNSIPNVLFANFNVTIDGRTCSFSRPVDQGLVSSLNCNSATINTNLNKDITISNNTFTIPYTGGNGGQYFNNTVNSTGVLGITANLALGQLVNGNGTLTYTLSGTPLSAGTASFLIEIGGKTCLISFPVYPNPGSISNFNCSNTNSTGALIVGMPPAGVSLIVPYLGGDGGVYSSQTINSTGLTGLTASLVSGNFNIGSGNLIFNISGTPSSIGTANFILNINGQTCLRSIIINPNLNYPNGTVFCSSSPTAIVDVYNPITGKIWMDRNLGATQVAASSIDASSYGDLYQWGRRGDGHQCRTSPKMFSTSSVDQPTNGNFMIGGFPTQDWRNPQNNNLWQGLNGINNPCPSGYRLPTATELDTERLSWGSSNAQGAFTSYLKLPLSGYRSGYTAGEGFVSGYGMYWSSTISGSKSVYLNIASSLLDGTRDSEYSVRCIKN